MFSKVVNSKKYKNIVHESSRKIMEFLLDNDINFSIICNIHFVTFTPPLPSEINDALKQFSVFVLAGYTFDSAYVDDKNLYFEAGFGPNDFGSNVKVPIESILNIVVEDNIIYTNPAATIKEEDSSSGVERSLSLLLSNPENRKFIKH